MEGNGRDTGGRSRSVHDGLGPRLRSEREAQSISMRALARRVGISASALSQIETGQSRPSVNTLYSVVSELGVSLDDVFRPESERRATNLAPASKPADVVQDAGSRATIELQSGVRWERLTPAPDPDVDFLWVTYEKGGASSLDGELVRHSGHEYGLVIEGRLMVTVGFETSILGPGDSISFASTTPHRLSNEEAKPARAVWVVIGRHHSDGRASGLRPAPVD